MSTLKEYRATGKELHKSMPWLFDAKGNVIDHEKKKLGLYTPKSKAEITRFELGGKLWIIENDFISNRSPLYHKWLLEFTYQMPYKDIQSHILGVIDHVENLGAHRITIKDLNKVIWSHNNLAHGLNKLDRFSLAHMYLCAVFINEENEDRNRFDEEIARKKVEFWMENAELGEHGDSFFFRFALNVLINSQKDLKDYMARYLAFDTDTTIKLRERMMEPMTTGRSTQSSTKQKSSTTSG